MFTPEAVRCQTGVQRRSRSLYVVLWVYCRGYENVEVLSGTMVLSPTLKWADDV